MNENKNEPIVLGELKKEKSSKPIFVLIVFILVLGILFSLPYIQEYFVEGNGPIVDFYNNTLGKLFNDDTSLPVSSNNDIILLKSDTVLTLDSISIKEIAINNKQISYKISSTKKIELDSLNYYLLIYSSDKKLLGNIKLDGSITTEEITKTKEISFAESTSYYLKLTTVGNK